ncbi:MAG: CatB-related O-acetyltransferase [Nitrososphaerota archaeon]|jgi:acetyltransferase-like isoleucine patch superfamily enzyme|nr:CatB-related O-acetyltransferase [Nitrososphaerota archaeon]MDG6943782.1 CatB-related O-acetyltransferase [Nitrososphaerota archaeon]
MGLKHIIENFHSLFETAEIRIGEWNGGIKFFFHGNKINVNAGKYSYGIIHVYSFQKLGKIKIGNYTSISEIKIIIGGNHHMDITTYPMKAVFFNKKICEDNIQAKDIIIGNDVWIGYGATILDDVKIGNGAIIGARAVVTKDIPDYAVVVGNPAKIVKYRFDQEKINKLLNLNWWELDIEDIKNIIPLFYSKDLDIFIKEVEKIKGRV